VENWVERCRRDYDLDREAILRERLRQEAIEEYDLKLEKFRAQNEETGFGLLRIGMRLLAIGEKIIKTFEDKEDRFSKGEAAPTKAAVTIITGQTSHSSPLLSVLEM
jgi:hypothetical protein